MDSCLLVLSFLMMLLLSDWTCLFPIYFKTKGLLAGYNAMAALRLRRKLKATKSILCFDGGG